jgi:hypothetical protein
VIPRSGLFDLGGLGAGDPIVRIYPFALLDVTDPSTLGLSIDAILGSSRGRFHNQPVWHAKSTAILVIP